MEHASRCMTHFGLDGALLTLVFHVEHRHWLGPLLVPRRSFDHPNVPRGTLHGVTYMALSGYGRWFVGVFAFISSLFPFTCTPPQSCGWMFHVEHQLRDSSYFVPRGIIDHSNDPRGTSPQICPMFRAPRPRESPECSTWNIGRGEEWPRLIAVESWFQASINVIAQPTVWLGARGSAPGSSCSLRFTCMMVWC